MEELKQLLDKVKGGIKPEIVEMLLQFYEKMPKKDQEDIINALNDTVSKAEAIKKYGQKRAEILKRGMERIKTAEKNVERQYKGIMKKAEAEEGEKTSEEAEELLKGI
ncbi:hypothetical protein KJ742_06510 [Patescibacteria group bacterium]|nr:hypothetical protein [Patescibacteria group bacterium]MBU1683564.1 hypothetical protein [Patescibacteria group bacterium]MBU1935653.1 hypothetical protein [Patescibacteria group bacterium]